MQVQHFMYFTRLCTLLTFLVYTPLLYQNLTFCTKLHHSNGEGGGHQFSRRKQILVGIDLKYIYALKIMLITMTFDSIMFPLVILFYIV